jgi:hypothetical protein
MSEQPNQKRDRVQIGPDPAAAPQDGDTLTFKPIGAKLLDEDTTVYMENLGAFDGAVLSFHFASDTQHDVDGSAVLVAPGIALTAKHVIEPHIEWLMAGEKHSLCVGVTKGQMNVWGVRQVTMLPHADIAILGLELRSAMPPDRTFRQAVISTRLPKIGDRVQIIGFRANEATRVLDGKQGYSVDAKLLVSAGVVKERYPIRRDSVMLPWPVLEVDCPSWGGMSGGPVFDDRGHLIGLLCSSFTQDSDDGVSYVSLVYPALVVKFQGGWPAAAFQEERTLLEMAPKVCAIERPEAVGLVFDLATGKTMTRYESWE